MIYAPYTHLVCLRHCLGETIDWYNVMYMPCAFVTFLIKTTDYWMSVFANCYTVSYLSARWRGCVWVSSRCSCRSTALQSTDSALCPAITLTEIDQTSWSQAKVQLLTSTSWSRCAARVHLSQSTVGRPTTDYH